MFNKEDYKIVCFGEILWDILPEGPVPGGAPMNVAYHLQKLGINPALITRIGIDNRGKELLALLHQANLNTDNVQLDYDIPTGIVNAKPNNAGDMQYDIVSPSAWDFIKPDAANESAVKIASHFIFGSLIARNKISNDTLFQLLELAQIKVLDINLRPPHYSRDLVKKLLHKADILKMNLAELELITGWFSNYKNISERIQLIQDKFQIPTVIITLAAEGAMVNINGKIYNHPGYIVNVADTVGSGDSFLAGFLFKIFNNRSPEEALTFACALGAFIASKTGAWHPYDAAQIESFVNNYSHQPPLFQ
jgi:fructokinase